MTASRPSRRKEGSSSPPGSREIGNALPRASSSGVQGMQIVDEPFVERIRSVNVDAIGGDDVIVLEANAADAGLSRVRLEIECHPFLKHYGRIFRCGAEVRSLPRIHAGAVPQTVENIRIGGRENLGVRRARTHFTSRIKERVVTLLMKVAHFGRGLHVS